jgi:hypothetical protein
MRGRSSALSPAGESVPTSPRGLVGSLPRRPELLSSAAFSGAPTPLWITRPKKEASGAPVILTLSRLSKRRPTDEAANSEIPRKQSKGREKSARKMASKIRSLAVMRWLGLSGWYQIVTCSPSGLLNPWACFLTHQVFTSRKEAGGQTLRAFWTSACSAKAHRWAEGEVR